MIIKIDEKLIFIGEKLCYVDVDICVLCYIDNWFMICSLAKNELQTCTTKFSRCTSTWFVGCHLLSSFLELKEEEEEKYIWFS